MAVPSGEQAERLLLRAYRVARKYRSRGGSFSGFAADTASGISPGIAWRDDSAAVPGPVTIDFSFEDILIMSTGLGDGGAVCLAVGGHHRGVRIAGRDAAGIVDPRLCTDHPLPPPSPVPAFRNADVAARRLLARALRVAESYHDRHRSFTGFRAPVAAHMDRSIQWRGDAGAARGLVSINEASGDVVILSTRSASTGEFCIAEDAGADGRVWRGTHDGAGSVDPSLCGEPSP